MLGEIGGLTIGVTVASTLDCSEGVTVAVTTGATFRVTIGSVLGILGVASISENEISPAASVDVIPIIISCVVIVPLLPIESKDDPATEVIDTSAATNALRSLCHSVGSVFVTVLVLVLVFVILFSLCLGTF